MSYETQFGILQGLTVALVLGTLYSVGWLVRTVRRYRK